MKTTQILAAAVIAVALAGGGFAAGMTVGRAGADATASPSPSGGAGRAQIVGRPGLGGAGGVNAQAASGRILSVNDGSITIEVRQPGGAPGASPAVSSQIVLVGASTRLVRTTETEIKLADLKANDQVTIVGTTDASGNLSATAIVAGGNAFQTLLGGQRGPTGGAPASPTARP